MGGIRDPGRRTEQRPGTSSSTVLFPLSHPPPLTRDLTLDTPRRLGPRGVELAELSKRSGTGSGSVVQGRDPSF